MPQPETTVRFDTRKAVDFVIVGSGASGGVLARELSQAGFDVVVLERSRVAGEVSAWFPSPKPTHTAATISGV